MPDPSTLRVGDRIRIVGVPKGDLEQLATDPSHLWTVRVLEWMVGREFVIEWVDEYHPWVHVVGYPDPEGPGHEHTMAIMDSKSWELLPG